MYSMLTVLPVSPPGVPSSGLANEITLAPVVRPRWLASIRSAPPPVSPEPEEAEEPEAEAPAEPPKPQVWEVVVVRGENTVKHGFPVKPAPTPESPAPPAEPKR